MWLIFPLILIFPITLNLDGIIILFKIFQNNIILYFNNFLQYENNNKNNFGL